MIDREDREIGRWRCGLPDGTTVWVVERQYYVCTQHGETKRSYPGASRYVLTTGEVVRYIDSETFELTETGELILRLT